jgi:DNA helicase-2/ATP-dependent DNA helicase PcrA
VLRSKIREFAVSGRSFHVDTIASWALRMSLSYSTTSGWTIQRPIEDQWCALYRACLTLLDCDFIRRILRASYGGLYVDEYQDCSNEQHELVLKLARDLPCRLLGDPMQGIFDFNGQPLDWARDVAAAFASLGELQTPHRWTRAGTPAIGAWLADVRRRLEQGQSVDLTQNLPPGVTFKRVNPTDNLSQIQGNVCRYFQCDRQESVIAIHKGSQEYKFKCHALAKNLAGRFSSIEEIEGKAIFSFVEKIQRARTDRAKLKLVLALAHQCMTAVTASLPSATARGEQTVIRENTRNPRIAHAANAFLADPQSSAMLALLLTLKGTDGVQITRADLFNRMIGILRNHVLHPQHSLTEAAEIYQAEFRYRGRPVGRRKLIATTLLVKGLEFDHAIILDAVSLSKRELYVALTRAARSLTIISSSPVLDPAN